jgi:hypothetical protein
LEYLTISALPFETMRPGNALLTHLLAIEGCRYP